MLLISAATAKLLRFKTDKSDGGTGGWERESVLYKAKRTSLIARLFATLPCRLMQNDAT